VTLVYFSLGSNMGDRGEYLRTGVADVVGRDPFRVSPVYETEPWGGVEQPPFWNLVLEVTTNDEPATLLRRAQMAEASAQRERLVHWGPRTLDVDILLIGEDTVDEPDLTVPHPRLWQRRFVLAPLADLRPDLVADEALAASGGEVTLLGTLDSLH